VQVNNTLLNNKGIKKDHRGKKKPRDNEKKKPQCTKIYSHREIKSTALRQTYSSPPPVSSKKHDLISPKMNSKPKATRRKQQKL
jgi:hypothetical protein